MCVLTADLKWCKLSDRDVVQVAKDAVSHGEIATSKAAGCFRLVNGRSVNHGGFSHGMRRVGVLRRVSPHSTIPDQELWVPCQKSGL